MVDVVPSKPRRSERKERILAAAADLVAHRGYHSVSMADIGAAAGIVGPGVYRHFDNKAALLTALFDRVVDGLLARSSHIVEQARGDREALASLIRDYVSLVLDSRELAMVYLREIHNLPSEDQRRLRRKQRLYLEEWVHLVSELRWDLDEPEVRVLVHGAIGAIQSVLQYRGSGLPEDRARKLLCAMAHANLGTCAPDDGVASDTVGNSSEPRASGE